jgi:hydroxymethylbilane synthase
LAKNYLCPQKAHTLTHIIRIGTRGSDLALWQARHVQAALAALGYNSDLVILKTKGDKIQDLSFDKIEGKGFFYQRTGRCPAAR